jgi:shikimate kinase
MVLDPENLRALSRNGHIFCLTASPDEIYRRLSSGIENRPLLSEDDPRGRIVELLAERQPDYLRFQQVDTDGMSASEIADQVAGMWRDRAL